MSRLGFLWPVAQARGCTRPRLRVRYGCGLLQLSAALAWCSASAGAQAAADSIEIVSELPGCVSATSLRGRVRELMGEQAWPEELQVSVQLRAAAPGFRVSRSGSELAQRRFARLPVACSERRDAIAIAIVVAIENFRDAAPDSTSEVSPSPEASAADGSSVAALSTARADAAGPAEPRAGAVSIARAEDVQARERDTAAAPSAAMPLPAAAGRVTLYAGGQWLWAAAPGVAAAFAAGMDLSFGSRWSVGLGGLWGPRAEYPLTGRPQHVSAQLFAGQLLGCWSTSFAVARLQGCAGGLAGALDAQGGRGFVRGERATLAWAGLTLRAAGQWPATGQLALRARLDGRINLVRPTPEVSGPSEYRQPVGVLGADIGLDILWRID